MTAPSGRVAGTTARHRHGGASSAHLSDMDELQLGLCSTNGRGSAAGEGTRLCLRATPSGKSSCGRPLRRLPTMPEKPGPRDTTSFAAMSRDCTTRRGVHGGALARQVSRPRRSQRRPTRALMGTQEVFSPQRGCARSQSAPAAPRPSEGQMIGSGRASWHQRPQVVISRGAGARGVLTVSGAASTVMTFLSMVFNVTFTMIILRAD